MGRRVVGREGGSRRTAARADVVSPRRTPSIDGHQRDRPTVSKIMNDKLRDSAQPRSPPPERLAHRVLSVKGAEEGVELLEARAPVPGAQVDKCWRCR